MEGLPRVALPADFVRMREAARARNSASAGPPTDDTDSCPELECSIAGSETAASEATQVSSNADTDVTNHSDGLLVEDEVLDQLLDSVVKDVQTSLSSVDLNDQQAPVQASANLTERPSGAGSDSKRKDELAGLHAAISNAVKNGSCTSDKMNIVKKAASQPPPAPESPPDAPRNPQDRRKRMRSGCFRYVCRSDVPNSISSLVTELKLIFDDSAIGLKLSEIFSALESHPDKPLEDTWWGVSKNVLFPEFTYCNVKFSFYHFLKSLFSYLSTALEF